MLQKINNAVTGWVAGIVLVIIALIFVFFGVENYIQGRTSGPEAARVGSARISEAQVKQLMQSVSQSQPSLPSASLRPMVIAHLVSEALLRQAATHLGLSVGVAQAQQVIMGLPALQKDGVYSPERLQLLLRGRQQTQADFVQSVQYQMLANEMRQLFLFASSVPTPVVNQVASLNDEQRTVRYAVAAQSAFMQHLTPPTDAQIRAYYQAHLADFQRPERVKLHYVLLAPSTLKAQTVSDEQIASYYKAHADLYRLPASYQVRMLVLPFKPSREAAKAKVDTMVKQLMARVPFASLMLGHGAEAKAKWVTANDLAPVVAVTLAHMKNQQISKPIATDEAWVLVERVDAKPASLKPLSEVKPAITAVLQRRLMSQRVASMGAKLADSAYSHPDSLKPVADAMGLPLGTTDWISRTPQPGASAQGLSGSPVVRDAAFSAEVLHSGNNSHVLQLEDGSLCVVHLAQHEKKMPKPLADVRTTVALLLRQQAADKAMLTYLASVEQKIRAQGMSTVPLAHGMAWSNDVVGRKAKTLPALLLRQAFSMRVRSDQKPAVALVSLDDTHQAIILLLHVQAGDAKLDDHARKALAQTVAVSHAESAFALYHAWLHAKADIRIQAAPQA